MRHALLPLTLLSLSSAAMAGTTPDDAFFVVTGVAASPIAGAADTFSLDGQQLVLDSWVGAAGDSLWATDLVLDVDPADVASGTWLVVTAGAATTGSSDSTIRKWDIATCGETTGSSDSTIRKWDIVTCEATLSGATLTLIPTAVVLSVESDAAGTRAVLADVLFEVDIYDVTGSPVAGDVEITLDAAALQAGSTMTVSGLSSAPAGTTR